jgi:hypothetical protein
MVRLRLVASSGRNHAIQCCMSKVLEAIPRNSLYVKVLRRYIYVAKLLHLRVYLEHFQHIQQF